MLPSGILNRSAQIAELFRRILLCACYVVNCVQQVGRHAAGSKFTQAAASLLPSSDL